MEWPFLTEVLRRFGFGNHWIRLARRLLILRALLETIERLDSWLLQELPRPKARLSSLSKPLHHLVLLSLRLPQQSYQNGVRQQAGNFLLFSKTLRPISHLFFADDLLIFFNGVICLLRDYEECSGQQLKPEKSTDFASKQQMIELFSLLTHFVKGGYG